MLSMKPDRTFMTCSLSCPALAPAGTVAGRRALAPARGSDRVEPLALAPALAYLVAVQREPLQSEHADGIVDFVALDQGVSRCEGQHLHQDVFVLRLEAENAAGIRRIDSAEEYLARLRAGPRREHDARDGYHLGDLQGRLFDRFA